ncbi:hypothetical protein CMO85_00235 [Candidatus Woesearchaeota archaeon]|nr:hypothetical protein [Candidatus Woesearchaeota archaeon]
MPDMAWIPGLRPLDLPATSVNDVIRIFKQETGEIYAEASVRHLPIPVWDANLLLVDLEQAPPRTVQGVMWATPFKDDIVRIAAFVIGAQHQGQERGTEAWNRFASEAWSRGFRHVQLEVKADNLGAQRFYERRGLNVQRELHGYYKSGLGYMMRGPLQPPSD